MDLHSLLTLLEAIERICTHKKAKLESFETASHKGKKWRNSLVPSLRLGFPRKSGLSSIATCARSMGVRTPPTIPGIVVGMRTTERRNLISALLRKVVRN